ncbi:choice-of-anchor J family PEP-CTERM protein [Massilia phyllosphaerae]|uniref:choice-of-anchor J family PEP-CTERM protein n=1 Tax=Massilia phyllosphaerae TaxID=3106034 RepID=UPI002B1CBCE3|nr:choice-of-anchor J domain-containing protein [Massilia sp. SGZ-792]
MHKTLFCALLLACAGAAHASIIESFDDVAGLAAKGFILRNASTPAGTNAFFQGNSRVFSAYDGASNAYLGANYDSAAAGGSIDDWLISPEFSTASRGTISFYARAGADPGYVDSFQFGLSTGGTGAADFVLGALTAAPTGDWTRYTLDFAGTGIAGSVGRFAIRYTGPSDSANYIGIDSLSVQLPEPSAIALLGLGLAGVGASRRRAKRV